MTTQTTIAENDQSLSLYRRHLFVGWAGLMIFLTFGIVLESLHGLKLNFYLEPRNVTRRLMWTLAHAHGTLFSLIQIAFAVSLNSLRTRPAKALKFVSRCLIGALITMPLGFFLGGLSLYGGDPGIGILMVPVGALILLVGVGAFLVILCRDRRGLSEGKVTGEPADTLTGHAITPGRLTKGAVAQTKPRGQRRG